MSVIERVRREREDLARVLAKYAGIRRIVEELYPDTAHFIYELLQNAEDTGASEASFALSPDSLAFEHDGRTFDEADIRAITNIGEGTKADDEERIGRFGIGFKAVFPYTETPRIWSPSYCFRIAQMVLPSELPPDPILGSHTRFEFPFDSAKKPRGQAFQEVRDGLEEISDNTLLFLSSIEEIQWRIADGREGRLLRIQHSEHHIEILREIDGRPTESSHFLRFTERVEGLDRQYSAIAFELEPLAGAGPSSEQDPFARRFRIVPADRGCVAVYFTAAKETSNLRFHLHAPFVPELSRSSIKDTPANEPLFRQLARLAAGSLIAIRDLGLLDRDFLAVLPHDRDTIPAPYALIREAIVGAMNDLPLTPVHSGGHAPARRLLQASAGLKALLDGDDLRFLVDGDDGPLDWAIAATQRNNDVDRFLRSLAIEDWDVEQFVEVLEDRMLRRPPPFSTARKWVHGPEVTLLEWMGQKPEAWHRALYALFHRELEKRLHRFRGLRIVRLSDGGYGTGVESFFPTTENHEDDVHPRVARDTFTGGSVAEYEGARRYLEGIGVREVGELQQVEAVLRQRYAEPDRVPHWSTYQSDLKRFDGPAAARFGHPATGIDRIVGSAAVRRAVLRDVPVPEEHHRAVLRHECPRHECPRHACLWPEGLRHECRRPEGLPGPAVAAQRGDPVEEAGEGPVPGEAQRRRIVQNRRPAFDTRRALLDPHRHAGKGRETPYQRREGEPLVPLDGDLPR